MAQTDNFSKKTTMSPKQDPSIDVETKPPALVQEHLFAARTVLIFGEVNTALARSVTAQLLALVERGKDPIRVLLHSPGGHVEAGDTIHDMIRHIGVPVHILGTGWVASAGALIYVAVPREQRLALPNTRFMLHQPLGGVSGPTTDIEIETRQILAMRQRLHRIFAAATNQSVDKIAADTERNHWMTAQEAIEYGLVGSVTSSLAP
jgi:ATP-dependent Clp protease, protease subunit